MAQQDDQARTEHIVAVLQDAFADLMEAAPDAFRVNAFRSGRAGISAL